MLPASTVLPLTKPDAGPSSVLGDELKAGFLESFDQGAVEEARKAGLRTYGEAKAALAAAKARPLFSALGYDRSAIMVLANAIAREQRTAVLGRSHRSLIGKAMSQAWAIARAARLAAAH